MERLKTSIPGLDQALMGGIPRYATVLLTGAPGAGKTILCQNILFNVSRSSGARVLYLSTISEPQIKVIRYQQQFSFFDAASFMNSVIFHDIGSIIRQEGHSKAIEKIDQLVMEHNPVLVAIDSLKAVADTLASDQEFSHFVSDLNLKLSVWGCTVLLLAEYLESNVLNRPESAIVDGIIYLCGTEERKHQKRFLRVLKMRGTDFAPGEHALVINSGGVEIYPRLNPAVDKQNYRAAGRASRQPTGITGLDRMMEGGVPAGSTTLINGATGTGKSLLGLKWLDQGCRENKKALMVSFDENPAQIKQSAASFGWDIQSHIDQGLLQILHISPIELDIDQLAYTIQAAMPDDLDRIVIDSITTFEIGMTDKVKYTDYLWGLADFFKLKGISLMLLFESSQLFGFPQLSSKYGISYIADNIIVLHYINDNNNIRRLIGVLKMRGTGHQTEMRELVVGDSGPEVLDQPPAHSG